MVAGKCLPLRHKLSTWMDMTRFYSKLAALGVALAACPYIMGSEAITLEVSDISSRDAILSITPADPEQGYVCGVARAETVEQGGGIDNIYESRDKEWWEYQASFYEDKDWRDFAKADLRYGAHRAPYTKLAGEKLDWDADYVLYAYTLDEDCAPSSPIYHVEFHTLAPAHSDISFEVEILELTADDHPNRQGFSKVTLRVTPSCDDPYGNYLHEARYLDMYGSGEDRDMDAYLSAEVYPFIASTRSGVQDLTYVYVYPDREYVLVSLGYDDGPTGGEIDLFRFSADPTTGAVSPVTDDVAVLALPGRIVVDGPCDAMAVFTPDGRMVGSWRSPRSVDLPAGPYLVSVQTAGTRKVHKVMVR